MSFFIISDPRRVLACENMTDDARKTWEDHRLICMWRGLPPDETVITSHAPDSYIFTDTHTGKRVHARPDSMFALYGHRAIYDLRADAKGRATA